MTIPRLNECCGSVSWSIQHPAGAPRHSVRIPFEEAWLQEEHVAAAASGCTLLLLPHAPDTLLLPQRGIRTLLLLSRVVGSTVGAQIHPRSSPESFSLSLGHQCCCWRHPPPPSLSLAWPYRLHGRRAQMMLVKNFTRGHLRTASLLAKRGA